MSKNVSISQTNEIISSSLNTGGPHFRSLFRQYKQSGYTLQDSIAEFIDNIIKKCDKIKINICVQNNKISLITISDNYMYGFKDINEINEKNPFNMGHIRNGQDDDDEISQFGVGFKAGAISTALKLTVYTYVDDIYYEIIMDFDRMCKIENPNDSYNPQIYSITKQKYNDNHPFENGSSLKLEQIHDTIYNKTTEKDLVKDLKNKLSDLFGYTIEKNNIEMTLNEELIKPPLSYFNEDECKPFNKEFKIYKLSKNKEEDYFYIQIDDDYYYIKEDTREFNKFTSSKTFTTELDKYKDYEYSDSISLENKE